MSLEKIVMVSDGEIFPSLPPRESSVPHRAVITWNIYGPVEWIYLCLNTLIIWP